MTSMLVRPWVLQIRGVRDHKDRVHGDGRCTFPPESSVHQASLGVFA